MTPYQTRIAMQGHRDRQTTLAWQTAVLMRNKRIPKLETLLTKKKRRGMNDLMQTLKGVNHGN
jgi:hypothetical protein